jgi:hypothetical protein
MKLLAFQAGVISYFTQATGLVTVVKAKIATHMAVFYWAAGRG